MNSLIRYPTWKNQKTFKSCVFYLFFTKRKPLQIHGKPILLSCEPRILHSFQLQLDVESPKDVSAYNLNYEGFHFSFEFSRLKSLVKKQKLRTTFGTFIVKLCNMILLSVFKSMFYSFQIHDPRSNKRVTDFYLCKLK